MRLIAIIIIIVAILSSIPVFGEPEFENALSLSLSWDLGLKLCCEHNFNDIISIKAGAGTSLFLPMFLIDDCMFFTQEILLMINPLPLGSSFQTGGGIGIPVSNLIFYKDGNEQLQTALMFAPGAEIYCGLRFDGGSQLRIHIGTGYPFFLEEGEWRAGSNSFPLNLWPDLDIEFSWPLR